MREDVRGTLAHRLRTETEGEVLFDRASRGRYATDASIYQIMPVGVLVPRTQRDIVTAIDIARDLKVPVLPRGAGTSQCGQTVGAALVIDGTKHMRQVLELDIAAGRVCVQPGLVLDQLNAELKPHGLWFPVDVSTSAQATLGGMAGNNSCGARSIVYGNMVHNVLGATAWLADGSELEFGPVSSLTGRAASLAAFVKALADRHRNEIEARWPKVMRRVGGYNLDIFNNQSEHPYTIDGSVNLAHLLIGSEGTLAYTKHLTLQLAELPTARTLGVVNFADFHAAMDAAQHIVKLHPSALELVDATMIDLARANAAFSSIIEAAVIGEPAALLLVEFSGNHRPAQIRKLKELSALMADIGSPGAVIEITDDGEQRRLWEVRKAGLNIMMSLKGDGKPVSFIEDCAVPLEHLGAYTEALTEVFARHGTRGTWYAHASVGTLHVRPILDMRRGGSQGGAAKMRAIAQEASELVRRYKGAFSGEHGDGICRGEWIAWQFGPQITQAFGLIKQAFDPYGLFNPGKIVQPPPMDDPSLLRFAPPEAARPYRVRALATELDWSEWDVQNDPLTDRISTPGSGGDPAQGFAKAVEMCNNNGHCRKFDTGLMCPSYRVTRDEQHLTRGRANTLRQALSGQLDADGLTSEAVLDALDLCVSCKGCRRDCPTGVDMAKMKIEFMAQYRRRHGYTTKDHLIGNLPALVPIASRLSWLLNLRDRVPGLAWLSERSLGLSAKRTLPRWRSDTFWAQFDRAPATSDQEVLSAFKATGKAVALFVDTFNAAFEAENVWAAIRTLKSAGYRVHVVQKGRARLCCGRTSLAVGNVRRARQQLTALVNEVLPLAKSGLAIVGLEPSCLLTLRDEALALGLGESARQVSQHALLFEEFIAKEAAAERFSLAFRPLEKPVLLHGHCHQKVFGAVMPILQVLRLIPGCEPELVQSSCCGMAGSFGYEAKHYELSMKMAEADLLPAVRRNPDAIVLADGTSCRQQIAHGTGREALHVARLLEALIPQA